MTILNIQAHPDDADCHCGGTTAKYAQGGASVYYLICTKGNRGTYDRQLDLERLAAIRREETRAAARVLGVKNVYFLDGEDGFLYPDTEFRGRIMRVIRQVKPDLVMTLDPFKPYEVHPDHRTVGMLASEATVFAGFPHFYPVHLEEGLAPHFVKELHYYRTDSPNLREDITAYIDTKLEACYAHRSQIEMAGVQKKAVTGDPRPVEELGRETFRELALAREIHIESFRKFRVRAGHLDFSTEDKEP